MEPRDSMGSFPLRFRHDDEPDGLGWPVEGSYMPANYPYRLDAPDPECPPVELTLKQGLRRVGG